MTINEMNARCIEIHTNLEMQVHDVVNKLDSQEKEINRLSASIDMIHSLTASVDKLAINMDNTLQELKNQGARIANLESKPAKRWESIIEKIITTAVGILIGYLFSRFGLNG